MYILIAKVEDKSAIFEDTRIDKVFYNCVKKRMTELFKVNSKVNMQL